MKFTFSTAKFKGKFTCQAADFAFTTIYIGFRGEREIHCLAREMLHWTVKYKVQIMLQAKCIDFCGLTSANVENSTFCQVVKFLVKIHLPASRIWGLQCFPHDLWRSRKATARHMKFTFYKVLGDLWKAPADSEFQVLHRWTVGGVRNWKDSLDAPGNLLASEACGDLCEEAWK